MRRYDVLMLFVGIVGIIYLYRLFDFNYLLSSKAYSDSLGAKCNITYSDVDKVFIVTLSVGVNDDDTPYVEQTFWVRPIENVEVKYE